MEKILRTTLSVLLWMFINVHGLVAIDHKLDLEKAKEIRKTHPEKALSLLSDNLGIAELSEIARGEIYQLQGEIYYYELADKENALSHFYNAIRYFRESKNQELEYKSLVYIALSYKNLFHYDYAIDYYKEALALDQLDQAKRQIIRYNLARVLRLNKEYGKSVKTFEELISELEGSKEENTLLISTKTALALALLDSGALERSQLIYEEILKYAEGANDSGRKSRAINSLGFIKLQQQQYEDAESYLIEGLALKDGSSDQQSLLMSYLNLGKLYIEIDQPDKALDYYREGSLLDVAAVNHKSMIRALRQLVSMAKDNNELADALGYQERIDQIQDPYVELSERLEILHSMYKAERVKHMHEQLELKDQLIASQNRNLIGALIFTGCLVLAFVGLFWQYRKLKVDHDLIGWLRKQSKLLFFLQRKYNIDLEQAEKELDRGAY